MKLKFFLLTFLTLSLRLFSQSDYVIGSVSTEGDVKLPGTTIINLRTEQKVTSDFVGNFSIPARANDEIRIVRDGYDRKTIILSEEDFKRSLQVRLVIAPKDIEEVKLSLRPTGVLKKDISRLNPSTKVVALNKELTQYLKLNNQMNPSSSVPSAFRQPNLNAGQLNLVSLASALSSLAKNVTEGPKTTATYAETLDFYRRVKAVIDMSYFTSKGLDEYDFDVFLAYADEAHDLSKNYRKNFNKVAIESKLRFAFKEYLETHNFSKKKTAN